MADNVFQFPTSKGAKPTDFAKSVFQVKATLLYTDPVVWRRFIIPADDTFFMLGDALLAAFGWSGEYGFYFHKNGMFFDDPLLMESGSKIPRMKGEVHVSAAEKKICDLLKAGDSISFFYDMEDYWEIEVKIERVVADDVAAFPFMPVCLDGACAAPPEGVGGTIGYVDFCEVLDKPTDPRYQEAREWLGLRPGERFDREYFSIFDVNATFAIETIDDYEKDILPDNEADLREFCKMMLAEKMAMHACAEVGMRAMQEEGEKPQG
ncbi:MAG: plasmid pRiA4b ORF-3 family protein [Slackia sp.]|nr:plasmid pRiA4b ORF-3 family protein [Slackia sp.]